MAVKRDWPAIGFVAALLAIVAMVLGTAFCQSPHAATNNTPLDWKPEEMHGGRATNNSTVLPLPIAVPTNDVRTAQAAFDEGFAAGVRYGALAARRNPDVQSPQALAECARYLMVAEMAARAGRATPTR